MLRRIFICTVIIAFASQVCAGVQHFGNFIVNVPRGWTGDLQASTLVVKSDSCNASVAAAVAPMGEVHFEKIIDSLDWE